MYTILKPDISKKNDCIKVAFENFSLFQYIYNFAPNWHNNTLHIYSMLF